MADKPPDLNAGMSALPLYSGRDITLWDVAQKIDALEKKVDAVELAITGNGKPVEGLAVRVYLLEKWQKESNRRALYHTIASIVNVLILVGALLWIYSIVK